jgi:hypothetical protein
LIRVTPITARLTLWSAAPFLFSHGSEYKSIEDIRRSPITAGLEVLELLEEQRDEPKSNADTK